MSLFRRLFQGRAERSRVGQAFVTESEVGAVEASLEQPQEEASEEEVAGVEKALEGDESDQAEANESEVTDVEREVENP
jgi:hypothetical protein